MKEICIKKDYLRDLLLYPLNYGESGEEVNREPGKCNAFNYRKNNVNPVYIMQHHTVSDYDRTIKIFTEQVVSAHYIIDKEGVVQELVLPEYRAYHAGKGSIIEGSILNSGILAGEFKTDMNSKSIGIENVNSGNEEFSDNQILANIFLCQKLSQDYNSIKSELMLGHSDWAIGRKIDPSIFFPWELFANAKEVYENEGITTNFGKYPNKKDFNLKQSPDVVLSYDKFKKNEVLKEDVQEIQEQFRDLGYDIPDNELGTVSTRTQDAILAFRIHYAGDDIAKHQKSVWEDLCIDSENYGARSEICQFTENDVESMENLLDQF